MPLFNFKTPSLLPSHVQTGKENCRKKFKPEMLPVLNSGDPA